MKGWWESAATPNDRRGASHAAPPNNSLHPTAKSAALMRKTPASQRPCAAGDAGR